MLKGYHKMMASEEHKTGLREGLTKSELIKDDWRSLISAFYFPKISNLLTDLRIRSWIEEVNRQLFEPGQEAS